MDNQWLQAALWIGLALVATLLSVRIAISIALLEIIVGVIGGNFLPLQRTEWVNFLAGFGSILLTAISTTFSGFFIIISAKLMSLRPPG